MNSPHEQRPSWDTERLPAGRDKVVAVRQMFDAIAPRYDLVNRLMTFGLDVIWRRRAVRDLALPPGSLVIDLASGTGDLCIELRKRGHRPLSFDLSLGMLRKDRSGSPRTQSDILRLPLGDQSVDGAIDFFGELARVVKPGGRISLLDVGRPTNPIIRFGNAIHFGKVVPLIGRLLSDGAAYRYLPKSVAYLPPSHEIVDILRSAGFADAQHHQLSGGLTQLFIGTRNR